jgi:23S rRNA G2445 N2-methylase RlmL
MPSSRSSPGAAPACYALVIPGLEPVTSDEVVKVLGAEVKRTQPGVVVFRVPKIDSRLLQLRTTEDVFLLGWGTDRLTFRAEDLEHIRRWTEREADWERLLRYHHEIRPKPKGKPSYRLVAQMTGDHGYRRVDALKALARGMAGKLPVSWRPAEENASVEIWLTIQGSTAICGVRLSDRTMRHRRYKMEHLPASLRPTLAAAMVRLSEARPGHVVLDPMCGVGTILAEQLSLTEDRRADDIKVWGGDREASALRAAGANLRRLGRPLLARWEAARLPLPAESVDRIVSNPPFGKQLSSPSEVGPLYRRVLLDYDRVLRLNGKAVLLVSETAALQAAARAVGWKCERQLRVRVLGQPAALSVWRKENRSATMEQS